IRRIWEPLPRPVLTRSVETRVRVATDTVVGVPSEAAGPDPESGCDLRAARTEDLLSSCSTEDAITDRGPCGGSLGWRTLPETSRRRGRGASGSARSLTRADGFDGRRGAEDRARRRADRGQVDQPGGPFSSAGSPSSGRLSFLMRR